MNDEKKSSVSASAIVGVVLCIIFIPVIIINLILITSSYTKPEELPGVFGIKPAIVLSGSMEPTIQVGDMIFLHRTDPEDLKEGDVICYLSSGKAITHRIVGVMAGEDGKPRYITQGDANNVEDRLAVTADQVQGIWKGRRIGGLGNAVEFMQTTAGMILFVIGPLVIFFLWDIWRRHKADKADAARTAELEAELAELKSRREGGDGGTHG